MKVALFVLMVITPSGEEKQMFSKQMNLTECLKMEKAMTVRKPKSRYFCVPIKK